MSKDTKKLNKLLELAASVNPYVSYLDKSSLSSVTEWISTGSLALNAQISGSLYGGVPVGRVVQLAGPSQTGKTYFILMIAANAQRMGKTVVFFDSENAIDAESAAAFGLDISKIIYISTLSVENTRNTMFKMLKQIKDDGDEGQYAFFLDSLGNLDTELGESRMEKDSTSADMGTFAKSIKSMLKTLTNWARLTRTAVVFTNHVFDNPNEMYPSLEKNLAGGKAAIYLPSVTLQFGRRAAKNDGGKTIDEVKTASQKDIAGIFIKSLSVKNRFCKQYIEVEVYLSYSKGLDRYHGLKDIMVDMGVLISNGATYTDWNGNKLGYYKSWRKDVDLWENTLLPELETKIKKHWTYGNLKDEEDIEEDYSEDDDIADIVAYEEDDSALDDE